MRKYINWFAALFLLFSGGIAFSHWSAVRIQNVQVVGNTSLSSSDIQSLIKSQLAGSYAFLFPKNDAAFVPKQTITKLLGAKFSGIKDAQVKLSDTHTLVVTIEERKPYALWCSSSPLVAIPKSCYFVDSTGFIFAAAPDFSGSAYFEYFGGITTDNPIGQQFLDQDTFNTVQKEKKSFEDAVGVKIQKLNITSQGDYEFYLDDGSKFLYNNSQNFDTVLNNLMSLWHKKDFADATTTPAFDYIDLRFDNQIFYK